jgi:hypothetical protein
MKAKALATFRMGQKLIRVGDIFEANEEYVRALARNRLADPAAEGSAKQSAKPAKPAKPAKAKAKPKGDDKAEQVPGQTVSAPLAGTGEGVQLPPPEGGENLPPVATAPAQAPETQTPPEGGEDTK